MHLKTFTFMLKHTRTQRVFHYGKFRCIPRAGQK